MQNFAGILLLAGGQINFPTESTQAILGNFETINLEWEIVSEKLNFKLAQQTVQMHLHKKYTGVGDWSLGKSLFFILHVARSYTSSKIS